ncbi:hypothetical protein ACSR0Z_07355 [Streptomyces viridosporus]
MDSFASIIVTAFENIIAVPLLAVFYPLAWSISFEQGAGSGDLVAGGA